MLVWYMTICIKWSNATVTFKGDENNDACGDTLITVGVFPANTILILAPMHGSLYECGDVACTSIGNIVQTGDKLRVYYGYLANNDYSNVVRQSYYDSNGTLVTIDTRTSSLDFLQAIDPSSNKTITWTFQIFARSSVPRISVDSVVIGGISDFASKLSYSDPDGDMFIHEFYLFSDQANLVAYPYYFPGTCESTYCVFKSVPSQMKYYLSMVQYEPYRVVPLINRVKLAVVGKTRVNPAILGVDICLGLPLAMANVGVYVTLQSVSTFPAAPLLYSSGQNSVAYKGVIEPTKGKILVNGTIQYVPYNPYSYSAIDGICDPGYSYDTFRLEAIYSSAQAECLVFVDTNITTCLASPYHPPRVISFTVQDIMVGRPHLFKIAVFDPNDQTYGEFDHSVSPSSFFQPNGSVSPEAGIIFSRTIFPTGAIYDSTCTNRIELDVQYSSNVFCYISNMVGSYESSYYVVVDQSGQVSEAASITFENPHDLYYCSAQPYDGIESQECSSVGLESNQFWPFLSKGGTTGNFFNFGISSIASLGLGLGTNYIPITIHVFDYASPGLTFRIVIESLPPNGSLYRCKDAKCTQPGTRVNVGEVFAGIAGNTTYMLYAGNNNYFNYVIYDTKALGGLLGISLRDCTDQCPTDNVVLAIACQAQCFTQLATNGLVGASDYLNAFSDRKDVPFGQCEYASDFGCPDVFKFTVQTQYDSYTGNSYNVYVSNMPSGASLSPPPEENEYTPTVHSNFVIEYDDPDLDTWDVAVELNTAEVYIGSNLQLNVYVTNETECYDTGDCKGKITVLGLPSDIRQFLSSSYMSYIRNKDEPTEGKFTVKLWKSYWGPGRAYATCAIYDVYDNVPITPDSKGVIKADPASLYYSPAIDVYYKVKKGYENIYFKPKAVDIGDILVEVVVTLFSFFIPIPGLDVAAGLAGIARTTALIAESTTARGALDFIYNGGGEFIAAVVRTLQRIGRYIGIAARFIFRVVTWPFRMIRYLSRMRWYPKSKIPDHMPEPNPQQSIDDIAKGFIPKEQPIPNVKVSQSFFQRIYPRRSPRNPEVPEPPLVPKPEAPVDIAPPPAELTGLRGFIARSPLGRIQTEFDRLVATRTYRVINFIRNGISKLEKIISIVVGRLRSLYQRIKDLAALLRRVLALRAIRLLRWLTSPPGPLKYLSILFRRLLLYIILSGGALVADAITGAINAYLWAISALSSAISWMIHIFRFTREYSQQNKKVKPTRSQDNTKHDIEKGGNTSRAANSTTTGNGAPRPPRKFKRFFVRGSGK